MTFRHLLLALLLAGCSSNGCAGENFTVVLPAAYSVEETAEVQLGDGPVGFIESVQKTEGAQRVLVRVQDISKITDRDRFLPSKDSRGKHGLRILPRQGGPVQAGAVITMQGPNRNHTPESEGNLPPRLSVERRENEERQSVRGEHAPQKEPNRADVAGRDEMRAQRMRRTIERVFQDDGSFAQLNTPAARRFQELGGQLANQNAEEIAMAVMRDGEPLIRQLQQESEQAQKSGDIETAKTLRRMQSLLTRLRRQSARFAGGPIPGEEMGRRGRGNPFRNERP